ncbi:hypothetical protein D7W79_18520 [Corallococcus exercitus]|uniref:hypothetical protein n=1 Tax=Corallococcus exercitus TaxID=2316736 RepID=UPI000EA30432|nr:hypothetical protein [Corallococcus exercitus]RKG76110.1 hypothetical protein D7W79_18520 [Corallococcus exercitus]
MNTDDAKGGYLALRDEADLHSFRTLARSMLMEQDKVEDERSGNGEYLEVWRTPDRKRTLSWIESPRVFGRFLWYQGEGAENALKIASDALPSATAAEVRELLGNSNPSHDDLVALLHIAAYVTPTERADLLETFRRYLADPRRGVRLSAVRAYAIRCWPGLLDEIERISKEDSEPDVRAFATQVVEHARKEQGSNKK